MFQKHSSFDVLSYQAQMTTWQTLCCHLCDIENTLCLIVTC
jgi:hypothetical protein